MRCIPGRHAADARKSDQGAAVARHPHNGRFGRRQQVPPRQYDVGYSEPDDSEYDAPAPHRAHRGDVSHSRPVGQASSSTAHGYPASFRGQQQHGSSASTQPGSPGFFANMMGAAASHAMQNAGSHGHAQHGHAPSLLGAGANQAMHYAQSQNGHAASHGSAHSMMGAAADQAIQYAQSQQSHQGHAPSHGVAQSHSQGGQQDPPDIFRDMHLPPATRALLKFAEDKGLLDDLGKYFKVLPPSRDFKYSKCTGRKRAVCVRRFIGPFLLSIGYLNLTFHRWESTMSGRETS